MILVDTSAWVEFLRATGSPIHHAVRTSLEQNVELATTDVIVMELLAGARDDPDRDQLRRMLYGCPLLPVEGPTDYEQAAELYRACRAHGATPRKLTDFLIAAVAVRNDVVLLHTDTDFLTIARSAPLRLASQ